MSGHFSEFYNSSTYSTVQQDAAIHHQINFLTEEIASKNKVIDSLQKQYGKDKEEFQQAEKELIATRAYIKSMPTQQEIILLKKRLALSEDEQAQLKIDLEKYKFRNLQMKSEISKLHTTVLDLRCTLEAKTAEIEANKNTFLMWEQRRKTATQSGEITVEDALADKIDLETKLQNTITVASKREEGFKTQLQILKAQILKQKSLTQDEIDASNFLKIEISKLHGELRESSLLLIAAQQVQERMEKNTSELSEKLALLTTKEDCWNSVDHLVIDCFERVSRCRDSIERMTSFIHEALKNHDQCMDPSLLFPPSSSDSDLTSSEIKPLSVKDLKNLAEKRNAEMISLEESVGRCRIKIQELYVNYLSASVTQECKIQ